MRRMGLGIVLALTLVLWLAPVVAQSHEVDEGDKKFTITGEVRARWEYFDNLTDFADHDVSAEATDDEYDIFPYRVRIAARGQFSDDVSGLIELQNFGVFGDETPFKASGFPPFQSFESGPDPDDTNLYQGYLQLSEIGGSNTNVRLGRQEHAMGNELQMGDADFYNGLAYDGARAWWDFDSWHLGAFYYVLSENNEGCGFGTGCGSDNVDLSGLTVNFMIGEHIEIEPYLLEFRSQTPADAFFLDKTNFFTLGARATRAISSREEAEESRFDWNAEIAVQDGDIGPSGAESDHKAWLAEGWFGFNWACGDTGRSRVHIGTLISSGDDEDAAGLADDGDHEDYLFLFPDFHGNNRLGDSDLEELFFSFGDAAFGVFFSSGVTNVNAGYEWWGSRHGLMASFHMFQLTEEACVGLTCEDDLGKEVDVRYTYAYTSQMGFEIGVADFMPGDAIQLAGGGDDDGLRVWGQARLRF